EERLCSICLNSLAGELRRQLKSTTKGSRRGDIVQRLELVETLRRSNIRPEWLILRRLPVVAPAVRPLSQLESGKTVSSELNDLYIRVLHRNNQLKQMQQQNCPPGMIRTGQVLLQRAVDALLDNQRCRQPVLGPGRSARVPSLSDRPGNKHGRFRGNLL